MHPCKIPEKITSEFDKLGITLSPEILGIKPPHITLTFQSNWDTNGLFSYLSKNQQDFLKVKVLSSLTGNMDVRNIISRNEQVWQTNGINNWFIIDISQVGSLSPNYYTIRHRNDHDTTALRTWQLSASRDNHSWTILKKHENDESIKSQQLSIASWPIPIPNNLFYNYFKVTMTGKSSGNMDHFNLSNIEFYGLFIKN